MLAILFSLAGDLNAVAAPKPKPKPQPQPGQQPPCSSAQSPAAQIRRCSEAVYVPLYAQIGEHCKRRPRSCSGQTDSCSSISAKISAGYACTNARELVQQQCYRPGDPGYPGHMKAVAEAHAALRNCISIQDEKCQ
jgi:hypothetical protein